MLQQQFDSNKKSNTWKIYHGSRPRHLTKARSLTFYLFPLTFSLYCSLLITNCSLDEPPDPNVPQIIDDTMNITQLNELLHAAPNSFDGTQYVKLKGSWESFEKTDDPLGNLYDAIAPLGTFTAKKIMLDFTKVNGQNIKGSTLSMANSRASKNVIKAVRFPEDMETIGDYSFYGCASLDTITFTAAVPPTIGVSSFRNINNTVTIYVPLGTTDNYLSLKTTLQSNGAAVTIEETN
jgi:hypothetical protein